MKLSQILNRPIAFHRVFVDLTGSVKAAIMLSQAVYWQARAKQTDGYWYKTAEEWEEETGLTYKEQRKAREQCGKYLLTDLRGIPATMYYKVDEAAIMQDLFVENGQTSYDKREELESPFCKNINIESETTTETTTADEKPSPTNRHNKDYMDGIIEMAYWPKAKQDVRLKGWRALFEVALGGKTCTGRDWQSLFEDVDAAFINESYDPRTFIDWMHSQKGYEPIYWSAKRIKENYFVPRAAPRQEASYYQKGLEVGI